MTFLLMVWRKIMHKKLSSFLCVLLMALGVCIISLIVNLKENISNRFTKDIKGIDMVIGAKGSPLQLILSTVFQIDNPVGNVPYQTIKGISKNSLIKKVIPVSMGDSHKGFNIIGTDSTYYSHFNLSLAEGIQAENNLEVTVGHQVAKQLGLSIGSTFTSTHGLKEEGEQHQHQPFKVVGILNKNNLTADNLIICSLESIWEIHHTGAKEEITAAFIQFKSPMGLMTIPRTINQNTNLQAALPAIEIDRLLKLFDYAINGLNFLAILIISIAGISVFISLYNSLLENKAENALLLSMGASKKQLLLLLLSEALALVFLGYVFGLIISKIIQFILKNSLDQNINIPFISGSELILGCVALIIGLLAAIIPALSVYKLNISKTLAES